MHVPLCTCARTSLSTPAEVEFPECRGGAVSASLCIAKLFFKAGVPNNTPDRSCQLLFSRILIKLCTIKLGNCSPSDGYAMLPHCCFNVHLHIHIFFVRADFFTWELYILICIRQSPDRIQMAHLNYNNLKELFTKLRASWFF